MRKIWEVAGGVHPPENKQQSLQLPLTECTLASEYILPLNQHIGTPSTPIVKIGETVKKFQRIANAEGIFSATLHAPTSGEVIAIEDRLIAHPSGLSAPCIVIKADGKDTAQELEATESPSKLSHEQIVNKIRQAGIVGMGGAGFPSAVKLNPRSNIRIDTLILNGTECEPYITADDILMQQFADEIIAGALLLAQTLGNPKNILIGVEDNKPDAIKTLNKAAKGTAVEIIHFPTKYPSGGEKQLIYILTGKEVQSGQIPAQLGIVVQNVGTAVAAWRAVRYGEPLIERITTVVGQSLLTQRNMRVRIGTPMSHVLSENGFNPAKSTRLIVGGPMMGFALEQTEVPVVKTTNCILAPSQLEMPEAPPQQACIRCGHCAEACPAGLLPQQLYWYARADDQDKLTSHNLFDCIECGACSYVCPSAIPLVQYYRAAKGTIRQTLEDKQKSDRARERFEHRQARIAKEEEAKEAKRLTRKAAAEKNKARLEAGLVDEHNSATLASTAQKAVDSHAIDPNQETARLERNIESLNNRIISINAQIVELADDQQRVAKLTAQLKQTESKLQDAMGKHTSFTQGQNNVEAQVDAAAHKMMASPLEAAQKSLLSLEKRLATAQEKLTEAISEQKPTVDALQQGVEKLQLKIQEAALNVETAMAEPTHASSLHIKTLDAATAAIERAKEKVKAGALMSSEDKQAANIASLEKRLAKAKDRLAQAQQENDSNIVAFATGVEKLEQKLQDALAARK